MIRPIRPDDLEVIADLYAKLDKADLSRANPGYREFFELVLLEQPYAAHGSPSLGYEGPDGQLVGFIGSHVRRFLQGQREIWAACFGPIIVEESHRGRGIAGELLRRFLEGPQDVTFNDRSIDRIHRVWSRLGAEVDDLASIEWSIALAPIGRLADRLTRHRIARGRVPGGALLAKLDGRAVRGRASPPQTGVTQPLEPDVLISLIEGLQDSYELRPAYDGDYLSWLFRVMTKTVLGDLRARTVVDDGGRAVGCFVMHVQVHGSANVAQLIAARDDVPFVLAHLVHDAASLGAIEVCGRAESFLMEPLRDMDCRLRPCDWAGIQARDPAVAAAVRSGRSLISRLDGEWWMRPRPQVVPSIREVPPA